MFHGATHALTPGYRADSFTTSGVLRFATLNEQACLYRRRQNLTGHLTASIYSKYAIVDQGMLREAAAKLEAHHAQENRSHPMTPGEIERLASATLKSPS